MKKHSTLVCIAFFGFVSCGREVPEGYAKATFQVNIAGPKNQPPVDTLCNISSTEMALVITPPNGPPSVTPVSASSVDPGLADGATFSTDPVSVNVPLGVQFTVDVVGAFNTICGSSPPTYAITGHQMIGPLADGATQTISSVIMSASQMAAASGSCTPPFVTV